MIKFHTPTIGLAHSSYAMYRECFETNIYQDDSFFTIEQAMTFLPDAIFCHKLLAVLGEMVIKRYLFDKDFDFSFIQKYTDGMSNRYTRNVCCIGNNQQLLDGSCFGKKKECTKYMIDMIDACFLVPHKKTKSHPSAKEVFFPLEKMMRLMLYQSLTEDLQTRLLQFWEANFEISI